MRSPPKRQAVSGGCVLGDNLRLWNIEILYFLFSGASGMIIEEYQVAPRANHKEDAT